MKLLCIFASIVLWIAAVGCVGTTSSTNPTTAPTVSILPAPTNILAPTGITSTTDIPAPTSVPAFTNTPGPTAEPVPTDTPAPTNTLVPTVAPTPTNAPTVDLASLKPEGAPYEIVKKAMENILDAKSVRAKAVRVPPEGATETSILQYIKPDRLRSDLESGAIKNSSVAIRGEGIWYTSADGKWHVQEGQSPDAVFTAFENELNRTIELFIPESVQYARAEMLEGKPTFVFTYQLKSQFGFPTPDMGTIWVGALDGRAYKSENKIVTPFGGGKPDAATSTYEYDLPLTIEAPL